MVSHTHGKEVIDKKPDPSIDTTTAGKRDGALKILKDKTVKLQKLLETKKKAGALDEDNERKKKRLNEIIKTQLNIYIEKKGNDKDMIKLCNMLLKESNKR